MYNGGAQINQRTAQIIRFAGLILPVALVLQGLLIQFGATGTGNYVNDAVFSSIALALVALGVRQFLFAPKSSIESAVQLIMYHVLTGAYILFVSGFNSLLAGAWILLFFSAYAYFGNNGLRLSALAIIVAACTDSLLNRDSGETIIMNSVALLTILFVGIMIVTISRSQEVDADELSKSKAEGSLQRDRIITIINNLADAVLSTDKDGVVQVYNAASLNLLDTNSSLDGRKLDDILVLRNQEDKPISLFGAMKKSHGTTVRDDLTMTIADEVLRLEVTYSPIASSFRRSKKTQHDDGFMIILRDVTKAKSLEEERDEFISVVSHELRTPITIAEGTISNVQVMMDRPDIAKDILKQGINTAHEQVIFLAKMVNDLSTLSRAERGVADEAESIDVRALVHDLYTEYAPQAKQKGLHLDLDTGTRLGNVKASRLYLQELLQNFITNSIKYTKEGSVTLNVERKNNVIVFEVKDTGIGISKGDQAKIFNKFYRSEDYRTRETGGTGLGLYVALKLSKKLGTKIELTSRLNHGSSFRFQLPVDEK
jgi:signal transduction histidine kinase